MPGLAMNYISGIISNSWTFSVAFHLPETLPVALLITFHTFKHQQNSIYSGLLCCLVTQYQCFQFTSRFLVLYECVYLFRRAFSALTLLVGWQEGQKN